MASKKKDVPEQEVSWFAEEWKNIRRGLWIFLITTFCGGIYNIIKMSIIQEQMLKQQMEMAETLKKQQEETTKLQLWIQAELVKRNSEPK